MRIFVSGSRSFGAVVLDMIREMGHEVSGVSAPERPDRLRTLAEDLRIPVTDAGKLTPEVIGEGVDLLVAAHSHEFVPAVVRDVCRLGAIGYHPSLLPRHRGRDAVWATIEAGDRFAGGTVYRLTDGWDEGPVLCMDWCRVLPDDDASTLWRRELFPMGLRLLRRAIRDAEFGHTMALPQQAALDIFGPPFGSPSAGAA